MKAILEYIDPATITDLLESFENVTPTMFREPGFVQKYLRSPGVQTAAIKIGDLTAYIIAFRITNDNGFWVELAKSNTGGDTDTLFQVISQTAEKLGCKYIRFTTSRHGLVKLAQAKGYTAEAVLMTKAV